MSNKVNLGWLQDASGERIAPKTFMSQVLSEDGENLEKILDNTKEKLEQKINSPSIAKVGQILEVEDVDSNGKPIKWRAIDAFSSKTQVDWNQNDFSQLDYIKNKPFYSGYGNRLELIPFSRYEFYFNSPTYTGHHNFGSYNEEGLFTNDDLYIKLNKKYEVNWNGVIYELIGKSFIRDNIEYIYIGNLSLHQDIPNAVANTGELFLFVGTKYKQLEIICNYNEVSNNYVDLSLYECSDKDEYEVVARYLDEKYIPNNIPKIKSASVGQLLIVLGVDLDGKPNSFGVVDDDSIKTSDLNDYVKSTQYATSSKAGLVRTNTSYGTYMNSQYIQIYSATHSDIDSKSSSYRPIVPSTIDYAVKSGLSKSKLTWTETEKTNARNLIGAVSIDDIPEQSSSVQSDWSQNDGSESDYIKNRTHYDSRGDNITCSCSIRISPTSNDYGTIPLELHNMLVNKDIEDVLVDNKALAFQEDGTFEGVDYVCYTINGYSSIWLFVDKATNRAYLMNYGGGSVSTREATYTIKGELKQLDEKFIPDSVPKVSTASVGQILSVKAIDENGKPTEWETISIEDIANQVKAIL